MQQLASHCISQENVAIRPVSGAETPPPSVINPRFREVVSPMNGGRALVNPPILKIPLEDGKKMNAYNFRLSQDRDFGSSTILARDLPFAIFNPHEVLEGGQWYWQYRYAETDWSEVYSFYIDAQVQVFVNEIDPVTRRPNGNKVPKLVKHYNVQFM